jgi:hypothetical protein
VILFLAALKLFLGVSVIEGVVQDVEIRRQIALFTSPVITMDELIVDPLPAPPVDPTERDEIRKPRSLTVKLDAAADSLPACMQAVFAGKPECNVGRISVPSTSVVGYWILYSIYVVLYMLRFVSWGLSVFPLIPMLFRPVHLATSVVTIMFWNLLTSRWHDERWKVEFTNEHILIGVAVLSAMLIVIGLLFERRGAVAKPAQPQANHDADSEAQGQTQQVAMQ